jgi:hypothetical protein
MNQMHPNKPDAKQSGYQGQKMVFRPGVKDQKGDGLEDGEDGSTLRMHTQSTR